MGRLADKRSGEREHAKFSSPQRRLQQKSYAAQRLNRLAARLDLLATWRADLDERIALAQWHLERGSLFAVEMDDLVAEVKSWRLYAMHIGREIERGRIERGAN